jgi:formylglycine-generating enzyme required for sulfatase activity
MTIVPVAGQAASYCIDATEVTYEEYQAFYADSPRPMTLLGLPSVCDSLSNYTPAADWPAPMAKIRNPVVAISWCQAQAYCIWAGKHLCGKVNGGPNDPVDAADPSMSEWYNACSAQGVNTYPYGSAFDPAACNDAEPISAGTVTVQQSGGTPIQMCLGGVPGLFQMSGNTFEWEDSCMGATGLDDPCLIRGGSFMSGDPETSCPVVATLARTPAPADPLLNQVGFRCCQ